MAPLALRNPQLLMQVGKASPYLTYPSQQEADQLFILLLYSSLSEDAKVRAFGLKIIGEVWYNLETPTNTTPFNGCILHE